MEREKALEKIMKSQELRELWDKSDNYVKEIMLRMASIPMEWLEEVGKILKGEC